MKIWNFALKGMMLVLSSGVNASVINTLNGVDYEWLDLTETQGLNRNQVEDMLSAANPGNNLYGYQYASRAQVEELLLSYMSWEGASNYYSDTSIISGFQDMLSDFGYTQQINSPTTITVSTGLDIQVDTIVQIRGIYGSINECAYGYGYTCFSGVEMWYDSTGNPVAVHQGATAGFNSDIVNPDVTNNSLGNSSFGSYLVRPAVSTVPIPATVWLFGSGLIGLVGFARRKKAKKINQF